MGDGPGYDYAARRADERHARVARDRVARMEALYELNRTVGLTVGDSGTSIDQLVDQHLKTALVLLEMQVRVDRQQS